MWRSPLTLPGAALVIAHLCFAILIKNFTFRLNNNASKGADKIRLKELLEVAGIKSLNQNSDALNARSRTYRENGIVLRVTIDYSNSEDTLFWTGYV